MYSNGKNRKEFILKKKRKLLCNTISHINIRSIRRRLRNQFMTWWCNSETDVHECTHQKLTYRIIFGETNNNTIYLQHIFCVFHDAEKAHFRNCWITDVDSDEQFIFEQYRLPCNFRISTDLNLESDFSWTFAACVNDFTYVGDLAFFREEN